MDDRELLELAAKAAGIDVYAVYPSGRVLRDPQDHEAWSPLTDDGDALRLFVKIGCFSLDCDLAYGITVAENTTSSIQVHHDGDPRAATRRAIVHAAAEIGKAMK